MRKTIGGVREKKSKGLQPRPQKDHKNNLKNQHQKNKVDLSQRHHSEQNQQHHPDQVQSMKSQQQKPKQHQQHPPGPLPSLKSDPSQRQQPPPPKQDQQRQPEPLPPLKSCLFDPQSMGENLLQKLELAYRRGHVRIHVDTSVMSFATSQQMDYVTAMNRGGKSISSIDISTAVVWAFKKLRCLVDHALHALARDPETWPLPVDDPLFETPMTTVEDQTEDLVTRFGTFSSAGNEWKSYIWIVNLSQKPQGSGIGYYLLSISSTQKIASIAPATSSASSSSSSSADAEADADVDMAILAAEEAQQEQQDFPPDD